MTKYRVQIKPYKFALYTKNKIAELIKSGELTDKNKIGYVPRLNMGIKVFDDSKKIKNKSGTIRKFWSYEVNGLGWSFDKLQKRLIKKIESPEMAIKIKGFKIEIYLVSYSSQCQPGVIIDADLRAIANKLNSDIDIDFYKIHKEAYKISEYPW